MAGDGSALYLVLSTVVSGLRARDGYRAPWDVDDGSGTTVFNSAEMDLHGPGDGSLLVIGWPGADDVGEIADAGQTQATLSTAPRRTETGSVRCLLVVQTGDHEDHQGVVSLTQARAFAVLDDVARYLRADPSLGLMATYPHLHAQIGGIPGWSCTVNGSAGVTVEIEFEIGYSARI